MGRRCIHGVTLSQEARGTAMTFLSPTRQSDMRCHSLSRQEMNKQESLTTSKNVRKNVSFFSFLCAKFYYLIEVKRIFYFQEKYWVLPFFTHNFIREI